MSKPETTASWPVGQVEIKDCSFWRTDHVSKAFWRGWAFGFVTAVLAGIGMYIGYHL